MRRSVRLVGLQARRYSEVYHSVLGVLPYCRMDANEAEAILRRVCVIETQGTVYFPNDAVWLSKRNMKGALADKVDKRFDEMKFVTEKFLTLNARPTEKFRVSWRKPGCFGVMSKWVEEALSSRGYGSVVRVVQIWNRSHTCVVRFYTSRGAFFLKMSHPATEEAFLTQWITSVCPEQMPILVAISEEQNAFLTKSFQDSHIETSPDGEEAEDVTAAYMQLGRMQIKVIEHLKNFDDVAASGVPKSKLFMPKYLASQIDKVLEDKELQQFLEEGELHLFRSCTSTWMRMCDHLESLGIPCSIVHRDLRTENHARPKRKGECILFDWCHGCITHPFIHLKQMREVPGVTDAHVELYLSMWKEFQPSMQLLKEADGIANMVQPLLDAVDFMRCAKISEASEQGIIVSPDSPDRVKDFRAVASRLRSSRRFASVYRKAFG